MNINITLEKTWEEVAHTLNANFDLSDNHHRYRLTIEKQLEHAHLIITGIDTNGYNDEGHFFTKAQFIFQDRQHLQLKVMEVIDYVLKMSS